MLTQEKLQGLYRELRDERVLSVYIDGGHTNPADRRVWYKALEGALEEERKRIGSESPDDLDGFDAARVKIEDALEKYSAFIPERGWVGFATADGLRYSDELPVPMPDLVRWESGIRAAPYVRALKQDRMVVAAIADSQRARLFTYREGEIHEPKDLVADLDFGDLSESATSKRASAQTGSRGETGTDAGQRAREVSAHRLHARLVETVEELAGSYGFVVFGGTPEVVSALAKQAEHLGNRRIERASMHMSMSEAEVKTVLEDAASELTRRMQSDLLRQVIDAAKSGGRGCLGIQATTEALRGGQVDALLISRGMRERQADLADRFVGTAFEHGASVEELSADEAERLDTEGEGAGARLRYTV